MKRNLIVDLNKETLEKNINLRGYVDNVKNLGGISFITLRDRTGIVQVVVERDKSNKLKLQKNTIISISGNMKAEEKALKGFEIVPNNIEILSSPIKKFPIGITIKSQDKLEMQLKHRIVSLRNPKNHAIFKIEGLIAKTFRDYLSNLNFSEIFTPKIVPAVAESGSNLFELNYFGNKAFLSQSPQFYKQIMVGSGLERVFEIGHVYRAEDHDTSRHLNEYVSMDLEMGFIDSYEDIMNLEEDMLRYVFSVIKTVYNDEITNLFNSTVPEVPNKIPRVKLAEMKEILNTTFKKKKTDGKDIDPEGERLANKYIQDKFGSEFVFLTHYPTNVRPFYTMRDPENNKETLSFDLLMRGLEITTGGQRIHDYNKLQSSINEFGLDPKLFTDYLSAFEYGMPPHGGLGMGIERLVIKLLGLKNVREASLFPRDRVKYSP